MVNINTKTLAQFYGVLLYKKKDNIAIQKKLSIGRNANQLAMPPDSELMGKTLADSYKLLLKLVGDLIPIQENLNIDGNPILEVKYQSNKASANISFGEIFNLLMYLKDDIIAIQEELGIVGYSNQERAEEADKITREYLQKFEKFHGPLEDAPSVLIQKFINKRVKTFYFTGEGLPLFPKVTSQQLHKIFVKNFGLVQISVYA
ncbi:hypothetical protein C1645_733033 [Glomus cerebriforme]|uniref:Uncharacterized protein n=1 Tax=Glomus cerebriforme TaxID=658196 RepID=A0A397TP16_9GLOM|nr:hypothetical protein C1645_733033 [Glomus cerebriforme]